jgi:hypothetical protein
MLVQFSIFTIQQYLYKSLTSLIKFCCCAVVNGEPIRLKAEPHNEPTSSQLYVPANKVQLRCKSGICGILLPPGGCHRQSPYLESVQAHSANFYVISMWLNWKNCICNPIDYLFYKNIRRGNFSRLTLLKFMFGLFRFNVIKLWRLVISSHWLSFGLFFITFVPNKRNTKYTSSTYSTYISLTLYPRRDSRGISDILRRPGFTKII